MAYRFGDRCQLDLFPPSVEDYVDRNDPVRAYNAFVNALDFDKLGLILDQNKIGNPEYDPKTMLKLIIYGTSYGIHSSRKLERAVYHNVSFIWLIGGLKPDHKTIAEFKRKNKPAIAKVLKGCARLCIKLGLIDGNILFVDGTKIRGNASVKNAWTREKCEKHLKNIDKRIEAILSRSEAVDREEQDQQSLVKMEKDLENEKTLKAKVENIVKELEQSGQKSVNTVDAECTRINSVQGSHAGYNAQAVVDEKHGLIVNADVVSENNDVNQFADQITQANETLEKKCDTACSDSGYANTDELEKIDEQGTKVIVPTQKQASKKEPKEFEKERFTYDAENDCYVCPEGHQLKYKGFDKYKRRNKYQIIQSSICHKCRHFKKCTKSKAGRTVMRLLNEKVKEKLEEQYKEPESQQIYKLRQQKSELPFGHIKRNLGVTSFLTRGRAGAKAEFSVMATCFNLVRMINILGVSGLIKKLSV